MKILDCNGADAEDDTIHFMGVGVGWGGAAGVCMCAKECVLVRGVGGCWSVYVCETVC